MLLHPNVDFNFFGGLGLGVAFIALTVCNCKRDRESVNLFCKPGNMLRLKANVVIKTNQDQVTHRKHYIVKGDQYFAYC